jgi:hypothetical protein
MSISIDVKKSKAVTRLIHDIAVENDLKQFVKGAVDENFSEEEFNNIIWFHQTTEFFREDEVERLPSPVTWEEFKTRLDESLSRVEYVYNRRLEYPSVEEQLDMIFKDIDGWKETIQAIKDKYPKP